MLIVSYTRYLLCFSDTCCRIPKHWTKQAVRTTEFILHTCTQDKGNLQLSTLSDFQQILFKDEFSCCSPVRILTTKKKQGWELKVFVKVLFLYVSTADSSSVTFMFPNVEMQIFSDIFYHVSIFFRHECEYCYNKEYVQLSDWNGKLSSKRVWKPWNMM